MKNDYALRASSALILTATLLTSVLAQNWTVGVPVNFHLTTLYLNGGCYPNVDEVINFPQSTVAGVQYIAVVTSAIPEATNNITPGLSLIHTGDTLFFATTTPRNVFFPSGTGHLTLEFYAIGTPTTAGQSHPCAYTQLWISDLGICPEGLHFNPGTGCIVQVATHVQDLASEVGHLVFPCAENGERLSITGSFINGNYVLVDAIGRSIASGSAQVLLSGIDLSAVQTGLYTITISDQNGLARSVRFAISGR